MEASREKSMLHQKQTRLVPLTNLESQSPVDWLVSDQLLSDTSSLLAEASKSSTQNKIYAKTTLARADSIIINSNNNNNNNNNNYYYYYYYNRTVWPLDKTGANLDEVIKRRGAAEDNDLTLPRLLADVSTMVNCKLAPSDTALMPLAADQTNTSRCRRALNPTRFSLKNNAKRLPTAPSRPLSVQDGCAKQSRASSLMLLSSLIFQLILCYTVTKSLWPTTSFLAEAIKLQPDGMEKSYWSEDQFVITCQNNHNIKNVKIRWHGPDQQLITDDRSERVHIESSGQHGLKLKVMNATVNDDGDYRCSLGSTDDKSPREQTNFKLSVYKRTSFGQTPHQVVLPVDEPGSLSCHVEFDQKVVSVEVAWLRNGKPIDMFNDSSYRVLDYDQSRQTSQLLISPVKRHHEGQYTCSASAQTPSLSKISEHNIYLETHYSPIFDSSLQTVWVERSPSINSHAKSSSSSYSQAGQPSANSYGRSRSRQGKPHYTPVEHQAHPGEHPVDSTNTSNPKPTSVRVELRCICRANPPASIVWTQTAAKFVLEKGSSPQVLDGPNTEVIGHNTTSVLVVNYSMEANNDLTYAEQYICSASNQLGNAAKMFKIEQGDPPPAFHVDPVTYDSTHGSKIGFTLRGPVSDGLNPSVMSARSKINPPIDMLRIRVDNNEENRLPSGSRYKNNAHVYQASSLSNNPSLNSQIVELTARDVEMPQADYFSWPKNITIDVSRLPKGRQRLILETHNSVGWSPNSTYLGDFYIVNAGAGFMQSGPAFSILLLCLMSVLLVPHRNQFARFHLSD